MKIKNIVFILLSVIISLPLQAQSDQERKHEEKGEKLLAEAAKKLKSYKAMKIEFTYEMVNEEHNISEEMSGVLISEGDKYRMEVGDNMFISDGETAWSYMEEIDEVHVNLVENTEDITPTAILDGFESNFRSKFIRQETYNGQVVDLVDLIPEGPQAFFKYRVALDASTKMIAYTTAYDRQGGTYTYILRNFKANPDVADDLFTFKQEDYPGVEIIDLR